MKGNVTDAAGAMVCSPYLALICGLVTLAVTIICSVYGKKTLKLFPFIIGIVAGYALAAILTGIGMAADVDAMKIIDFSAFRDMQWLPEFTFLTAFSGDYGANVGAYIGTIAVAYVPSPSSSLPNISPTIKIFPPSSAPIFCATPASRTLLATA